MTKKSALLMAIFATVGLSACATPLPKEQREFVFVENTTLKQKEAYNGALAYLAKNLGDSNIAIKVKDQESGTIITQVALECSELKGFLDPNRHTPWYNLEIQTKDNKMRFAYEALLDKVMNAVSGHQIGEGTNISTTAQATAAKTCAERNKTEVLNALVAKKAENW